MDPAVLPADIVRGGEPDDALWARVTLRGPEMPYHVADHEDETLIGSMAVIAVAVEQDGGDILRSFFERALAGKRWQGWSQPVSF
jgi:hypothetical protein